MIAKTIEKVQEKGFLEVAAAGLRFFSFRLRKYRFEQFCQKGVKGSLTGIDHGIDNFESFFFKEDFKKEIKKYYSLNIRQRDAILTSAQKILENDITWLIPFYSRFERKILWNLDPESNRKWPGKLSSEIDFKGERRTGDIREPWELNRHQFLTTLGKAYWITDDERYIQKIVDLITDWISENRFPNGINWIDSQEVSIRGISWLWTFFLARRNEKFREIEPVFMNYLLIHGKFVYRNLSDKKITNNHLITEAFFLFLIGGIFKHQEGRKWRLKGEKILRREIDKQFSDDGFHAEFSSSYHRFVTDSVIQFYILSDSDTKEQLRPLLLRMLDVLNHLVRPDGTLPRIGDCDCGRISKLSEMDPFGGEIYKHLRWPNEDVPEELFWLSGGFPDEALGLGFQKFIPAEAKFFEDAGIGIFNGNLNGNRTQLIFKGGATRLKKDVSFAHNHADFLSFEFFYKKPVFIDPGVYSYSKDEQWRYYYRSSKAHNCVVVDGIDHMDVKSQRFDIPHFPEAKINATQAGPGHAFMSATNNAYQKMNVSHTRGILWPLDQFFVVVDRISGSGIHSINSYLHLNSGLMAVTNENWINIIGKEKYTEVHFFSSNEFSLNVHHGSNCADQGWISSAYGVHEPAYVIDMCAEGAIPIFLVKVFIIGDLAPKRINCWFLGDTFEIKIHLLGKEFRIKMNEKEILDFDIYLRENE